MSTTIGLNRVRLNIYGDEVMIPNDNIAKLMYYLSCVSTVIDYNEPNILTDFKNYARLDNKGRQIVYELATLLNPQLFIDKGIFIVNADLLPDHLPNKFVTMTDETIGIHANKEIIIGGKTRKVLNIMICEPSWLFNFYHNPIKKIEKKFRQSLSTISENYITETSTQIVTNQIEPTVISVRFKSNPVSLFCTFCKRPITTKIKRKFNIVACCCCFFFSIYYVCIQACRGKNILCCDVIHKCPNCGLVLGEYNAC